MPYICLEEKARKQTPPPRRRGVSLDPRLELTWTEVELRCRLVEGVSTARAGGRVRLFVSAGRMERHSIRAGLWLPPPNIFESGRRGNSSPVMLQDHAVITKKKKKIKVLIFFREAGDDEPFYGSCYLFSVPTAESFGTRRCDLLSAQGFSDPIG